MTIWIRARSDVWYFSENLRTASSITVAMSQTFSRKFPAIIARQSRSRTSWAKCGDFCACTFDIVVNLYLVLFTRVASTASIRRCLLPGFRGDPWKNPSVFLEFFENGFVFTTINVRQLIIILWKNNNQNFYFFYTRGKPLVAQNLHWELLLLLLLLATE